MTQPRNKDCFNCTFDDCVYDGMDYDDCKAAEEIEASFIAPKSNQRKRAYQKAYQKAYREANKEKLLAYKKAYYEANKEKIAAYHKACREANKQ